MWRVVLLGDSIRMGYQSAVVRELAGYATVWGPEENGRDSATTLEHLHAWALGRECDLVHINCGLHDLKRDFGAKTTAVPLDRYATNVEKLLGLLLKSGRKVIWATTTPVNEKWHHARKDFDRFEADVRAYNDAASAIATRLGAPIDDLFGLVMRSGRDESLSTDGVHFTETGYAALGRAVAQAIRRALGPAKA